MAVIIAAKSSFRSRTFSTPTRFCANDSTRGATRWCSFSRSERTTNRSDSPSQEQRTKICCCVWCFLPLFSTTSPCQFMSFVISLRCSARLVFLALCKTRSLSIPLNTNTLGRPADSITGSRLVANCVQQKAQASEPDRRIYQREKVLKCANRRVFH